MQDIDGSGLVLPGPQSLDDHLISGPASVAASDQQEQFVTPQNSSPSMQSLSNSSQPATPPSNTAADGLSSEPTSTNTGITDDVTEAGIYTGFAVTKQSTTPTINTAVQNLSSVVSSPPEGLTDDVNDASFSFTKQSTSSTRGSAVKHLTGEANREVTLRHSAVTGLTNDVMSQDLF